MRRNPWRSGSAYDSSNLHKFGIHTVIRSTRVGFKRFLRFSFVNRNGVIFGIIPVQRISLRYSILRDHIDVVYICAFPFLVLGSPGHQGPATTDGKIYNTNQEIKEMSDETSQWSIFAVVIPSHKKEISHRSTNQRAGS